MALAGVASVAICFSLLFLLFSFDSSINDVKKLKSVTQGPVLGKLNHIKKTHRNIDNIWNNGDIYKDFITYKNLLRSLRFEVDKILVESNSKILGITSLRVEDNKVFSAISVAYAFARLHKHVLIIGNEEMASELHKLNFAVNQVFSDLLNGQTVQRHSHITFVNNGLGDLSLLENQDKSTAMQVFDKLKNEFDLIIIYLDGLNSGTDTKEWLLFTDNYMTTFMAGRTLNSTDKEAIQLLNHDEKFIGWLMTGAKDV